MNKLPPFGLVILFALGAGSSPAAGENLIASPHPGLAWRKEALPESMRTRPADDKPGQKPDPARKEKIFIKEENVMGAGFLRQKLQLRPGSFLTRYVQGNMVIQPQPAPPGFSVDLLDEGTPGGPADTKTFAGFEWLHPRWLTGTTLVDGVACDIYVAPLGVTADSKAPPPGDGEPHMLAAIGKTDRLPRRLESPYLIWRFAILPNAAPPPELPPGVVEALAAFKKKLESRAKAVRFAE